MTEMNVTSPPARGGPRETAALAIVREWFLRERAVAEAPPLEAIQRVRRERARTAMRLADAALGDDGPEGVLTDDAAPALAVSLYREAAYWALAARAPDASPANLTEAIELAPDGLDDVVREALVERTYVDTAELTPEAQSREALAASAYVHGLVNALDARERAITERWTRITALLVALFFVTVGYPLGAAALRPSLAATHPWRASSAMSGFAREGRGVTLPNTGPRVFFHTESESAPWVAFDLERREAVRSVTVINRADCCQERAVPLVLELSDDGAQWNVVARRDEVFDEWKVELAPRVARHVRLRALGTTNLHFANVEIH